MVVCNQESCIGCGQCVRDCIAGCLALENGKAQVKTDCIYCGHCVAICPVKAMSIPEYDMADVEEHAPGQYPLDPEVLLHNIKFRRSIRNYQQKPVEQEKLEYLLQAGRYTATAKNFQDCRFVIIQEELSTFKELVWGGVEKAIAGELEVNQEVVAPLRGISIMQKQEKPVDYLFRNAPAVIYIASPYDINVGLAAQNIELAAVAQGLGVMYNGYLGRMPGLYKPVADWLEIVPEGNTVTSMLVGYPAVTYRRTAPRRAADVIWK